MVDVCVYLVVEGVGCHAEEVGDGVVHVGAEGVDGVADAKVVELRDAEGPFGPGLAVVEVADMVTTAPTDVVQPRILADDPQHLVPTRAIEGILLHREELRIVIVVTIEEGGLQLERFASEGMDGGHLLLQRAVTLVQLLRQRQQPLVDHLEAPHLGLGGVLLEHLVKYPFPRAQVVVNHLLRRLVPIAIKWLCNTQDIILAVLQPLAQLVDVVFLFLHILASFRLQRYKKGAPQRDTPQIPIAKLYANLAIVIPKLILNLAISFPKLYVNLGIKYAWMLFKAAEPVEGLGAPAEVGAGLEAIGGALEGDGAVGALPVAIAENGYKPEKEVQKIEWNNQ